MILVTGATGNVGSQVVQQLLAQGRRVRVFTRDAAKVAGLAGKVEVALGDMTQPKTFAAAVKGVEAIFLMNGALEIGAFRQLLNIAKEEGTPRTIYLSSLFAEDPGLRIGQLHKAKEDALRDSGLPYAIVRAGNFMTNSYQWIGSIRAEGVVYNPMGEGLTAMIAPEDIAAVAVYALTAPQLRETVFGVTGPALESLAQRVEILSKYLGRKLRTVDVTADKAVEGLKANGVPPQVASAVAESLGAIREGRAAAVTDTVERVTGRPPRTYEQWVKEHAARFA